MRGDKEGLGGNTNKMGEGGVRGYNTLISITP